MAVIDTVDKLSAWLPRLRAAGWVALDTEADSLHAYPEKLCLLQISIPDGDELIDPLAGLDLAELLRTLHGRELLLHGADYDLRLLRRELGFTPVAVLDTMWAARLLGCREFGLVHLVARYLGVRLEKSSQKAVWSTRPLTPRMTEYARNDTRYLKPLSDLLRAELARSGRLGWLKECCARMVEECAAPAVPDPDRVWRLSGSQRLRPPGLAILRELWHWREGQALAADKPPFFILPHDRLVQVADQAARGVPVEHLVPQRFSPGRRKSFLAAVHRGLELGPQLQPHPLRPRLLRLTEGQKRELERLKSRRDRNARELGLEASVIASRAGLVSLAADPDRAGKDLMRWQLELLQP